MTGLWFLILFRSGLISGISAHGGSNPCNFFSWRSIDIVGSLWVGEACMLIKHRTTNYIITSLFQAPWQMLD